MKIGIKTAILGVMLVLAAFSAWGAVKTVRRAEDPVPDEIYAALCAKSGRAQYLLREEDGVVAVYRSGENRADRMTGIETAALRRSDRAMLRRGIPAEDIGEVLLLLEDLGS
ncbi:MAG: hypothetical protein IJI06_10020 [Oscillospiraceae bacterium]|nr:hypothetical protein [Oscillospiraceae bacterium]HAJ66150.1 hypothetical protein [Clostridiales bacterium]